MKEAKLYKDCYQLSINIFFKTKTFNKAARPNLGRRLEETAINLVFYAHHATARNVTRRAEYLDFASVALDELRILLNLCFDTGLLSVGFYGENSNLMNEIGKQIGAFAKYDNNEYPSPAPSAFDFPLPALGHI